ncbi:hypothetical protein [Methylobacterium ajmalii]|jgi:hypothetical protein|uniref:hypothetical protein n=1 Tax=Methylobacterium ajmalii TaxID=2738439 RepID=UPI00190A50B0|nr:hypothetical protein [Methylobacterium ajmalii]MBK3398112.1 hypothetical protein [Methylobacterium ajmalii]MBK3406856.1 hypothetical protein [Methylobacterium ajmalii]MBK3420653.1 hypothetical protein [Methylobacterium ajmalii]MBZ6415747.1 hypothetical protein [Methylobacterium sp.]
MSHVGHIGFDVASRGAQIFTGLQFAIADFREREARRRRDGICAVADIAMRLEESREIEAQACDAAAALDAENARLRQELAAARVQIAGLEQDALAYAKMAGLI